jgi:hypothetical protein
MDLFALGSVGCDDLDEGVVVQGDKLEQIGAVFQALGKGMANTTAGMPVHTMGMMARSMVDYDTDGDELDDSFNEEEKEEEEEEQQEGDGGGSRVMNGRSLDDCFTDATDTELSLGTSSVTDMNNNQQIPLVVKH